MPCNLTDSWVAAYTAPKFEMVSPYEMTELSLLVPPILHPY